MNSKTFASAQKYPVERTETAECHEPPVFRAKTRNSVTSDSLGYTRVGDCPGPQRRCSRRGDRVRDRHNHGPAALLHGSGPVRSGFGDLTCPGRYGDSVGALLGDPLAAALAEGRAARAVQEPEAGAAVAGQLSR